MLVPVDCLLAMRDPRFSISHPNLRKLVPKPCQQKIPEMIDVLGRMNLPSFSRIWPTASELERDYSYISMHR